MFHLAFDDAEHCTLAFGIVTAKVRRHDGRTAERASTIAGLLSIMRPGALARNEAAGEFAERAPPLHRVSRT